MTRDMTDPGRESFRYRKRKKPPRLHPTSVWFRSAILPEAVLYPPIHSRFGQAGSPGHID
jgi:hypothetical protein